MADGMIQVSQTLQTFLPENAFMEVITLLKKVNLKVLVERRYSDWLNGQGYSKSCENLDEKSQDREKIAAVIENLVQCAEPFIEDEGGWDKEEMLKHETQASAVLKICQLLLSSLLNRDNQLLAEKEFPVDAVFKKFILKKTCSCLVALCAVHMESHLWTSTASMALAHELVSLICTNCQCPSVQELLCGCVEVESVVFNMVEESQSPNSLFPSGLFRHILDYLRPHLLKNNWKKFPLACHGLVWCTLQIKHPYVGEHFAKLMSPLLLLIDDYETENKTLGFKCLKHVIDNVNSAELQWYGRADVLFEASQRHIYSNDPSLMRSLHPCLLSILTVVEPSPKKAKFGRKTTKCDGLFQIILSSMEFESKIAVRKAYASHLKHFIEHMGITILRHFKRLLKVIVSYLEVSDYPEEGTRLAVLDALKVAMLQAWPRIPNHSSTILKSLLKLLVDATDSSAYIAVQAFELLNQKTAECLVVLLRCCGKQVEEQLKELQGVGHKEVEECVEKVLQETGCATNTSVQSAHQMYNVT
ncbi:TELO2-interacting protein 2-like [Pocillopora damicornis]|uniref:TELO2-interacting protein 2-like n=1 Tax=Pocillopora damicornis TaxID=46731 RepID=UPI000F55302D|nr:TELO2-interacting protein 2-like [Pocillopora damicornis]